MGKNDEFDQKWPKSYMESFKFKNLYGENAILKGY